jgi:hypothetical protein
VRKGYQKRSGPATSLTERTGKIPDTLRVPKEAAKTGQKEDIRMPWKESRAVDERKRFIEEWKKGEEDFAELCRCFGIARETG